MVIIIHNTETGTKYHCFSINTPQQQQPFAVNALNCVFKWMSLPGGLISLMIHSLLACFDSSVGLQAI